MTTTTRTNAGSHFLGDRFRLFLLLLDGMLPTIPMTVITTISLNDQNRDGAQALSPFSDALSASGYSPKSNMPNRELPHIP